MYSDGPRPRSRRLGPDPQQLVLKVDPGQRIERRQRLVHQHHFGIVGDAACERAALAHATRKLVWVLVVEAVELDQRHALAHPPLDLGTA